jgi:hypothetical protein
VFETFDIVQDEDFPRPIGQLAEGPLEIESLPSRRCGLVVEQFDLTASLAAA